MNETIPAAEGGSSISKPVSQMGGHTQGPWEASSEAVWAKSPWNARVRIASITQFASMNGIDTAANARLIAAAPDLLALLQELIDIEGPQPGTRDWYVKVRAAIAKATGAA